MKDQIWRVKEFESLRLELHARVKFLHQTINLAIIFWLVSLITVFYFLSQGIPKELIITYILILPIIFDLLGYNYQSNQNSLESIAKYIYEVVRPSIKKLSGQEILQWEKFFAVQKAPFKFESTFKIFPFVLPSFLPIILLLARTPLTDLQRVIAAVDLILFALLLENFRYKLRRVK